MSGQKLPLDLRPQARSDIKSILKYTTQRWGAQQRGRYKTLIERCLDSITANPLPRSRKEESIEGYYRRHVGGKGRHFVYYRLLEDSVLVVRILHDSMDVERHLPDAAATEPEE
ncbi:type II toxin-antitoxin system RelE/ParE family toxin [Scytonema sp. UIC 10036]|uniref:type II toxin-antitoxin system RelE/ParE family toxin n=1 Tax=Scytonema sp. UIC 10036 TaxID=2304196 RepID=UPI0012DAB5DD